MSYVFLLVDGAHVIFTQVGTQGLLPYTELNHGRGARSVHNSLPEVDIFGNVEKKVLVKNYATENFHSWGVF